MLDKLGSVQSMCSKLAKPANFHFSFKLSFAVRYDEDLSGKCKVCLIISLDNYIKR